ncbi:hypothetical protein C0J52_21195 [Blattella germanica]|nr:hypothetical protein C0J52_21195 [Blattella germanica]
MVLHLQFNTLDSKNYKLFVQIILDENVIITVNLFTLLGKRLASHVIRSTLDLSSNVFCNLIKYLYNFCKFQENYKENHIVLRCVKNELRKVLCYDKEHLKDDVY